MFPPKSGYAPQEKSLRGETASLEFAVLILPSGFVGDGFHHIPVFGDLAVFHSPKIIVGGRRTAEGPFADGKNKVALCQHLMRDGVDHLNVLLGKSRKCGTEPGKAVGNAGIVLKVGVAVKIIRCLFGTLTLHNIVEEVLDKRTVRLGLVRVLYFLSAVDLRSSRRIGICFCRKVIPVLCNLSVFVKAEDVKGNLLSCACEVVNRLKENLVAVFKSADIVYRGFTGADAR